jgi:anthranilate synthase/aminodeoxychorismate synthase-like glutamine amidotransferase
MILLIDNYDSFVHNLARYLQRLGHETRVLRNDAVDIRQIRTMAPAAIVLSPGPCTPDVAGKSLEVVHEFWQEIPILGVCLGHQTIAAAFGGTIVRAREPVHGRTSPITHDERGVFAGLPNPLTVCRYHSLIVEESSLPDVLEVSARFNDETIMAIRHRHRPVIGIQFHPESILTTFGYAILANFLGGAGLKAATDVSQAEELVEPSRVTSLPDTPVTF